jgi:hypothetical protein
MIVIANFYFFIEGTSMTWTVADNIMYIKLKTLYVIVEKVNVKEKT